MKKLRVIESRSVERDYGFDGVEAIVEHEGYRMPGRLYIADGYGGEEDINGGCVRWEHGIVCRLRPDDTLDTLDGDYNGHVTIMEAMTHGYDDDRPVMDWPGRAIAAIAQVAGLQGEDGREGRR